MKLYIMRHGEAVDASQDPSRPLTNQGIEALNRMASALAASGTRINHILHSPRLRTTMTADIMAKHFHPEQVNECPLSLDNVDVLEDMVAMIQEWSDETLLVGHMPFVAHLTSQLLSGQASHLLTNFVPGAIACLEPQTPPHWVLSWFCQPNLFYNGS